MPGHQKKRSSETNVLCCCCMLIHIHIILSCCGAAYDQYLPPHTHLLWQRHWCTTMIGAPPQLQSVQLGPTVHELGGSEALYTALYWTWSYPYGTWRDFEISPLLLSCASYPNFLLIRDFQSENLIFFNCGRRSNCYLYPPKKPFVSLLAGDSLCVWVPY